MLRNLHVFLILGRSRGQRRLFHASRSKHASYETISIPCASNGNISLDVYAPTEKISAEASNASVAIFLPRGSVCADEAADAANIEALTSILPCHVVQINYRCSRMNQYPTPIHDVATGFDWIVSNLLPKRAIIRPNRSEHVGKLAVCGELIGGQLATMLALTECRIGEPGIVAAAINNPITDWVGLDENGQSLESKMKTSGLTIDSILKQRSTLFRKPEHYHDPFASPALFFRTSGHEVSDEQASPPADELAELAMLERDEYLRESGSTQTTPDIANPATLGDGEGLTSVFKKRKSSRKFPSKQLGLRLPRFSISAGTESPILGQATELTKMLEQSFARQAKAGSLYAPPLEANEMVELKQNSGLGLWDETREGHARMKEVARWMAKALGH